MPLLLDEGRAAKNGSKEAKSRVMKPNLDYGTPPAGSQLKFRTTGLRLEGSVPPLVPRQIFHMTFEALWSRFP